MSFFQCNLAIDNIWAFHHLWMLGSVSSFRVLDAAREVLPSDCVCKACFQGVENLPKVESNPSSILNMLKASIQPSVFTTLQIITNLYFQVPGVNTSLHHWDYRMLYILIEPPEFWRSTRNVCYINQTVFRASALYCKQYIHTGWRVWEQEYMATWKENDEVTYRHTVNGPSSCKPGEQPPEEKESYETISRSTSRSTRIVEEEPSIGDKQPPTNGRNTSDHQCRLAAKQLSHWPCG